ncbi:hypothetical protein BH09PAT2_BH09PAT2_09590 [soil metagenome]
MAEKKQKTPAPVTQTHSLPSVGHLFREAWDVAYAQAGRLVMIGLYSFVANFILALVFIIIICAFTFIKASMEIPGFNLSRLNQIGIVTTKPEYIFLVVVFAIVFAIGFSIVNLMANAGTVLTLADEKKAISPWIHFKYGFKYVWPLFIAGLIVVFLAIGGFFFFIIPYFIFLFAFTFYAYAIILEKKTSMAAIKMSAAIVFQRFWPIVVRIVLLWLAYIAIYSLFSGMGKEDGEQKHGAIIFQFLMNIVMTMYSTVYSYLLYKHARKSYTEDKPISFTWIWLIASIGLVIAIVMGIFVTKVAVSEFKTRQKNSIKMRMDYDRKMKMMRDPEMEDEYDNRDVDGGRDIEKTFPTVSPRRFYN